MKILFLILLITTITVEAQLDTNTKRNCVCDSSGFQNYQSQLDDNKDTTITIINAQFPGGTTTYTKWFQNSITKYEKLLSSTKYCGSFYTNFIIGTSEK